MRSHRVADPLPQERAGISSCRSAVRRAVCIGPFCAAQFAPFPCGALNTATMYRHRFSVRRSNRSSSRNRSTAKISADSDATCGRSTTYARISAGKPNWCRPPLPRSLSAEMTQYETGRPVAVPFIIVRGAARVRNEERDARAQPSAERRPSRPPPRRFAVTTGGHHRRLVLPNANSAIPQRRRCRPPTSGGAGKDKDIAMRVLAGDAGYARDRGLV